MFQESVHSYFMAWSFARRYLSDEDGITENLKTTYEKAKAEIEKKMSRTKEMEWK